MKTTYRNPWYKPTENAFARLAYGPEFYSTDVEPQKYRGYLIYHRLPEVWDVVKDGVCITQMAGPNGARLAIDKLVDVT